MSDDKVKSDEIFDDNKKSQPTAKHTLDEDKIIIDNTLSKSQDKTIEQLIIPEKKNPYSIYWAIAGITAVIVLFIIFYNDPKNTKIRTALNPIEVNKDSILTINIDSKNEILTFNKEYQIDFSSLGSNSIELINLAIKDKLIENKIKFTQNGNEYRTDWFKYAGDDYKLIFKTINSNNLLEINSSYYKNKSIIDKFIDKLITEIKCSLKLKQ